MRGVGAVRAPVWNEESYLGCENQVFGELDVGTHYQARALPGTVGLSSF